MVVVFGSFLKGEVLMTPLIFSSITLIYLSISVVCSFADDVLSTTSESMYFNISNPMPIIIVCDIKLPSNLHLNQKETSYGLFLFCCFEKNALVVHMY